MASRRKPAGWGAPTNPDAELSPSAGSPAAPVLSLTNANDWQELTLGDAITLKRGYDLPNKDRRPGKFPIVSSAGSTDWHDEAKVDGPGVVTGRYGTIGLVFYVESAFWPLNTTLYVEDFKGNYPRFISYLLRTIDFRRFSDKAAVPGINRNHLHTAKILLPPLATQAKIAEILAALDDRIGLLRQTNTTLEAIAQTLFKSWFVDFDPVRAKAEGREPDGMNAATAALFPDSFEESPLGLIPQGWRARSLDSIANYLNGLALQKFPPESDDEFLPVIKIAQLRAGNTTNADLASARLKPEYVVHDGDVLFSWSGSLEVEFWCGGDGALNQHLFKVTSAEVPKWFYYLATRQHLPTFRQIAASKATTMGHIQRQHLTEAKIVVPPLPVLAATSAIIEPLLDRRISNSLQMRQLTSLRDTLLPRLISGQLPLPEVQTLIKEATP